MPSCRGRQRSLWAAACGHPRADAQGGASLSRFSLPHWACHGISPPGSVVLLLQVSLRTAQERHLESHLSLSILFYPSPFCWAEEMFLMFGVGDPQCFLFLILSLKDNSSFFFFLPQYQLEKKIPIIGLELGKITKCYFTVFHPVSSSSM